MIRVISDFSEHVQTCPCHLLMYLNVKSLLKGNTVFVCKFQKKVGDKTETKIKRLKQSGSDGSTIRYKFG